MKANETRTNGINPKTNTTPEEAAQIVKAAEKFAETLSTDMQKRITEMVRYYKQAAALLPLLPRFHAVCKANGEEYANVKLSIKADGAEIIKYPSGSRYELKDDRGAVLGWYRFGEEYDGSPVLTIHPANVRYEDKIEIPLYDQPNAYKETNPNGDPVPPCQYRGLEYDKYGFKRYILGSAKLEERFKKEIETQERRAAEYLAELDALPAAVEFIKEEAQRIHEATEKFGFNGVERWRNNSLQYFIKDAFKTI